jgi:hypothetical protein
MSKAKLRHWLAVTTMFILAGCGSKGKEEDAIRTAINARLASQSSLNTSAFDTDIQKINVQGNQATADVIFKVKGGPGQMQLTYNLTKQGGNWAVVQANPITLSHSGADPAANGAPPSAAPPSDIIDSIHGKLGSQSK